MPIIPRPISSAFHQVDRRHLQLGATQLALGPQRPEYDVPGVQSDATRVIIWVDFIGSQDRCPTLSAIKHSFVTPWPRSELTNQSWTMSKSVCRSGADE